MICVYPINLLCKKKKTMRPFNILAVFIFVKLVNIFKKCGHNDRYIVSVSNKLLFALENNVVGQIYCFHFKEVFYPHF